MAKFPCPFGHTEVIDGKLVPMVHLSRARCAIYRQLRNQKRIDVWGNYLPGKEPSSPSAPVSPDAPAPSGGPHGPEGTAGGAAAEPAGPSPPSPPAPAKKEGFLKRLQGGLAVRYRAVTTTPPLGPDAQAQNTDWEVSPETSERFGAVITGFIQQAVDLFCVFMEIPKVPQDVFAQDPGEAFIWRTTLRGFVTNIMIRVFRAKSPEDADRVVAGLSGVLTFGLRFIKIGIHLTIHLPKSPKLAAWRLRAAEAKKKREADAKLKAQQAAEKEQADILARATGRPAGAAG